MTARAKARAHTTAATITLTAGIHAALNDHATITVITLIATAVFGLCAYCYRSDHRRVVAACERARHAVNGRPLNAWERAQWQQLAARLHLDPEEHQ